MDYREAIMNKFGSPGTREKIRGWLDENHPDWDDDQMRAEYVLVHAIGYDRHGNMTVDETEEAEHFINNHYLEGN